jgi:hypothetical protein
MLAGCGRYGGGRTILALLVSPVLFYWSVTAGGGRKFSSFSMRATEVSQRGFREDVRLLAYFYPQYHRIPENDEFW